MNPPTSLDRRRFVQGAASTFLGVGLMPPMLQGAGKDASPLKQIATAKRVIYLYMGGGMTHLDTFDVKPGAETQGPTKAIKTSADGVQMSEYLPKLAKQAHHMALINSMYSKTGAHAQANYLMHTSYEMRGTIKHPNMGAWLQKMHGRDNVDLPANVVVGGGSRHPGNGFFETKYAPVSVNRPEAGLQNVKNKQPQEDFEYRLGLGQRMAADFREKYQLKQVQAYTDMYDDAVRLMKSKDLEAFDLTEESKAVRDAYGDNNFGQGCLLARRLVEHGVKFVEVSLGGWDTHQANFVRVPERCRDLDAGMATLINDLHVRGLLDDTMVVLATEFGRTPRINQNVGRDHYPKAFSCVLAGGGIVGGQRYGSSDETGENVVDKKMSPPDLNATIAYGLGLPLDQVLFSPSKRPFTVAHKGQPHIELYG